MREVLLPQNLDQLWSMRREHPQAVPYAGGTDLLVRLRSGAATAQSLICLERIAELAVIEREPGGLFIGAGATMQALLQSSLAQEECPVLCRAASLMGGPAIRHMATLGGNLVTASPAGDTLPALYVLEAEVELLSPQGSRRLAIDDFILGPGRTALRPEEILGRVWLPQPGRNNLQHYEKVGKRQALAISVASLAAAGQVGPDKKVRSIRLAWGSVGPKVLCAPGLGQALVGRKLSPEALMEVGGLARAMATPISDIRASREYRLDLVANLPLRLAGLEF